MIKGKIYKRIIAMLALFAFVLCESASMLSMTVLADGYQCVLFIPEIRDGDGINTSRKLPYTNDVYNKYKKKKQETTC